MFIKGNSFQKIARGAFSIGLAVAIIGSPSVVQSEELVDVQSEELVLEEVVVTARKREESVQDVPIAINVLAGDKLNQLGVFTTDDIANLYPNMSVKPGSAINSGLSIRGVGTSNFHVTALQAVGQYMDEVSLVSPFTSTLGLFDMERVEVLRGPQNTLFGRNTTGGAVNYVSRKPEIGGEANGYVLATFGNEGKRDLEGAVGFSVGDTVAIRAAIQTVNRDGVFNDLFDGDELGEIDRQSGRVQFLWAPSDRTEVLLNAHVGYSRGNRSPYKGSGVFDPNGALDLSQFDCPFLNAGEANFERNNGCLVFDPRAGGSFVNISTDDWNDVVDAGPPVGDVDFEGAFAKIRIDFDAFTFTSITSFDQIEVDYNENTGGVPYAGFFPGQDAVYEVFSQEFRLTSSSQDSVRWITGAFYSSEDDTLATIVRNGAIGTPPFTVIPSVSIAQDVTIASVYGQIDIDLSERLTLTAGLRYTDDKKDGISTVRLAAGTDTGDPFGTRLPDDTYISLDFLSQLTAGATAPCPFGLPCENDVVVEQKLEETGGKLGLNYQFTDNVMGYASYSRGFKSGAFDTRALAAFSGNADRPVGPEFLDAFEIGFKSTLADGQIELNGAIFYYIWEDLQQFDNDPVTGAVAFLNVPESEVSGAELDFKWVPAAGWYVQAGIGVLDSEITDAGGLISVVEGAPLTNTPELSYNALVIKDFELTHGVITLQADVNYKGERYSGLDKSPITLAQDSTFFNARASYLFGFDRQYEISIWGENIGEEKSCGNVGTLGPLSYSQFCLPNPGLAFYGITFRLDF